MRWIRERLVMLMTIAFVALAVGQNTTASSVAVGIAVVAVGMLVAAQYGGLGVRSRELTVGGRAHAHKESLVDVASPRHPLTPGRPLSRAPGRVVSAA